MATTPRPPGPGTRKPLLVTTCQVRESASPETWLQGPPRAELGVTTDTAEAATLWIHPGDARPPDRHFRRIATPAKAQPGMAAAKC
ncbi:unnamed protein product [Phytophthora lilii]|uniref:Unnamed protein product n=1 Tax=Phytophthora lilii TaxID=2077276 RepID=A0A9W6WRD5_9STRA|nr:unnamed protein product [Phytophthora lilii]